MVNTKGSVYLGEPRQVPVLPPPPLFSWIPPNTPSGGAPDTAAVTGGKFSAGLSGCVRNLILANGEQPAQTVDLQAYAAATGVNVQPCSS